MGKKNKKKNKKKDKKKSKKLKKVTRHRTPARRAAAKPETAADRRSKIKPETLRLRSAIPSFTVADVERSIAYYQEILGFYVKDRWIHDDKLMGAELVAGAVTIYVGQDDWQKGRERVKGEGFRVYCGTAMDVDQLAALIKARGGRLLEPPQDRPWGTRDFAVQDPDGFKITFATEAAG